MSKQEKDDTIKEAKILEALDHPNIIRFREVYTTKRGKLCIVMDYADGNLELNRKGAIFRKKLKSEEADILTNPWFSNGSLKSVLQ